MLISELVGRERINAHRPTPEPITVQVLGFCNTGFSPLTAALNNVFAKTDSNFNLKGSTIKNGNAKSRKLKLVKVPPRIGSSQLPNPPIRIGMTIKKIIRKACAVTRGLYA